MTVDELIAQLQRFRGDLPVEVSEVIDYDASEWQPAGVFFAGGVVQIGGEDGSSRPIPPDLLRDPGPKLCGHHRDGYTLLPDADGYVARAPDGRAVYLGPDRDAAERAVQRCREMDARDGVVWTDADRMAKVDELRGRLEAIPPELHAALLSAVERLGVAGVVSVLTPRSGAVAPVGRRFTAIADGDGIRTGADAILLAARSRLDVHEQRDGYVDIAAWNVAGFWECFMEHERVVPAEVMRDVVRDAMFRLWRHVNHSASFDGGFVVTRPVCRESANVCPASDDADVLVRPASL